MYMFLFYFFHVHINIHAYVYTNLHIFEYTHIPSHRYRYTHAFVPIFVQNFASCFVPGIDFFFQILPLLTMLKYPSVDVYVLTFASPISEEYILRIKAAWSKSYVYFAFLYTLLNCFSLQNQEFFTFWPFFSVIVSNEYYSLICFPVW